MAKINLRKIAREIRNCEFAPKKWEFETIETTEETKETSFGKMIKYIITIRFFNARCYNSVMKFQVCHYLNGDAYSVFYDGMLY